jgi:hypothetical protein
MQNSRLKSLTKFHTSREGGDDREILAPAWGALRRKWRGLVHLVSVGWGEERGPPLCAWRKHNTFRILLVVIQHLRFWTSVRCATILPVGTAPSCVVVDTGTAQYVERKHTGITQIHLSPRYSQHELLFFEVPISLISRQIGSGRSLPFKEYARLPYQGAKELPSALVLMRIWRWVRVWRGVIMQADMHLSRPSIWATITKINATFVHKFQDSADAESPTDLATNPGAVLSAHRVSNNDLVCVQVSCGRTVQNCFAMDLPHRPASSHVWGKIECFPWHAIGPELTKVI